MPVAGLARPWRPRGVLREVVAVGHAHGVALDASDVTTMMGQLDGSPRRGWPAGSSSSSGRSASGAEQVDQRIPVGRIEDGHGVRVELVVPPAARENGTCPRAGLDQAPTDVAPLVRACGITVVPQQFDDGDVSGMLRREAGAAR